MALNEVKNYVTNGQGAARGTAGLETATMDAHARYQLAVSQGNCFMVADQSGAQMPAGLSASPVNVTLFNPKGNNKFGVLWYAGLTSIVAPAAAATIWVASNSNVAAAATTGTVANPQNCQAGNQNRSTISVFTTATLPAAPIAIAVLGALLTGAITTITQAAALSRWFDGSVLILPGASLSFQASTQSGAAGTFGEWIWEERPLSDLNA